MGAAPRRITSLVESLTERGIDTRVIAPLPNYPEGKVFKGFRRRLKHTTRSAHLRVDRLFIYPSKSKNPLLRVFSMLSFALALVCYLPFIQRKHISKVIVQSPPLFVSFTAVFLVKRVLKKELVLNVSDLWPMSATELGVLKKGGRLYRLLLRMERFIYQNADRIAGQSEEIIAHITLTNRSAPKFVYRNLPKHLQAVEKSAASEVHPKRRIVYAGLLGFAQGVAEVCRSVDFASLNMEFHIYGKGMEEDEIKAICSKQPQPAIFFHGAFQAKDALAILKGFDASLVPLTNRIYGAVPSKVYELIHAEVPMIFAGGGEGAALVEEHQIGLTTAPGDMEALRATLQGFSALEPSEVNAMKDRMRILTQQAFNYELQFDRFLDFVQSP